MRGLFFLKVLQVGSKSKVVIPNPNVVELASSESYQPHWIPGRSVSSSGKPKNSGAKPIRFKRSQSEANATPNGGFPAEVTCRTRHATSAYIGNMI